MWRSLLLLLIITAGISSWPQTQPQTTNANPASVPSPLPFPAQIKNAVVFVQTDFLHDFTPDIAQLTPDVLSKLSQEQVTGAKHKLILFVENLRKVKLSVGKLTPEEIAESTPDRLPALELQQLLKLVSKMAS
jgi:hypothetical protein